MIEYELANFFRTFIILFSGDCILGICYGYNKKLGITIILLGLIGLITLATIAIMSLSTSSTFNFSWGSTIAGFLIGLTHSTIWKKATDVGKELKK